MNLLIGLGCSFLLKILHLLFALHLQLNLLKHVFAKLVYNVSHIFVDTNRKFQLDSELIAKSIKEYPKIPQHLTFVLGDGSVSYDDLVQIILWTLPTGIPALSFYDHKNRLDADKLYDTFRGYCLETKSRVKWGISFSDKHQQKVDSSTHCLQVNVLTSKHGRQLLIDSLKDLCLKHESMPNDRAAIEAILDEEMFPKMGRCSNPDFMVINGNVYTTYGFSPWHLTFTEFLTIPSYRFLTPTAYVRILATFANCEQKFGR